MKSRISDPAIERENTAVQRMSEERESDIDRLIIRKRGTNRHKDRVRERESQNYRAEMTCTT